MPTLLATLVLLCLLLPFSALAIDHDKKMHGSVSAALGVATGAVLYDYQPEWHSSKRIAVATVAAVLPGVLKECTDSYFDTEDLGYDILGALAGAAFSEALGSMLFIHPTNSQVVIGYQGEWP